MAYVQTAYVSLFDEEDDGPEDVTFKADVAKAVGNGGDDRFTFEKYVSHVDMGDDNDTVVFKNFAGAANVILGDGDDRLLGSNADYIAAIDAGAGNDFVVINGAGTVDLGTGADQLTANGYVGQIHATGTAGNTLALNAGAGTVDLSEGNDVVTANAWLIGLTAGGGDDDISLSAGGDTIDLGDGADILNADGYIISLDTGDGDDTVTLNASGGGGIIDLGEGNDTFQSTSGWISGVDGGLGDDNITIAGGTASGGADNDHLATDGDSVSFLFGDEDDDILTFTPTAQNEYNQFNGGSEAVRDTLVILVEEFSAADIQTLQNDLSGYSEAETAYLSQFNIRIEDVERVVVKTPSDEVAPEFFITIDLDAIF